MYSPGFFPKGYLCKPFNGGYYEVQGLAAQYGFDPAKTPWNEMSPEAQRAFLFGDPGPITFSYQSRTGRTRTRTGRFPGFYGWIGDWDVGGTYTDTQICSECHGGKLRPEYAAVSLAGQNLQQLSGMSLDALYGVLERLVQDAGLQGGQRGVVGAALSTALHRLHFLRQVGLGYVNLDRPASTLSAGEAERIALAGLLGSGLTSLTVLLDEPTRGLHPREVGALLEALVALRDEGNTVIVVEHDLDVIRAADHLIDMGPGAGAKGGEIVAQGPPSVVADCDTATAWWLRGERRLEIEERRRTAQWMTIRGAREHNLRDIDVRFPLGALVGLCGVSGSGKSTLLIDTLGRVLAPKKQTTSVAYEKIDPGEHDAIEGAPRRVMMVDQAKTGLRSPASYLGLNRILHALYAEGEDAQALGLDEKDLGQRCSVCGGSGAERLDMGFLPDVYVPCETCRGTGYRAEACEVAYGGSLCPRS
jgi:excinuclease ABC subunit A